jgi:hypothetical protein
MIAALPRLVIAGNDGPSPVSDKETRRPSLVKNIEAVTALTFPG